MTVAKRARKQKTMTCAEAADIVPIPCQPKEPDVPNDKRTPMVSWESVDPSEVPGLVWAAKFDGRFQIEVQRKNDGKAVLCIFDHDESDRLLHTVDVGLSCGAGSGPDVDDILCLELLVTQFIGENFSSTKN